MTGMESLKMPRGKIERDRLLRGREIALDAESLQMSAGKGIGGSFPVFDTLRQITPAEFTNKDVDNK